MIFNLICGLTSDWDQPIEDIKVTTLARDFLQVLKEKVHLLPSVSRYLMPEDYLMFAICSYVINHHDALFATHSTRTFPINLRIDLECLLWSLNPVKLHTSVLIKNVARKVHALSRDLTQRFPKITMNYYFIEGSRNPADLNSKIPPSLDPIEVGLSTYIDICLLPPNQAYMGSSFPSQTPLFPGVAGEEIIFI